MILTIIIALISLVLLMALHEFGHFIAAKYFKIDVEEFGIGYPPKIWAKKFKGTLYSLNLIPFGAFVKIVGESEKVDSERSYSTKPFWQKSIVILGGVVSFWIVSAIIFTYIMASGFPSQIEDNENYPNAKIQILAVAQDSPADKAGIRIGDEVVKFSASNMDFFIDKVKDFQDLIAQYKGKEVALTIVRGSKTLDVSVTPRASAPEGQGALGVALARTAIKSYPWHIAPIEGVKTTYFITKMAVLSWYEALSKLFQRQPTGVQIMGPVGIFSLFAQAGDMGVNYFLQLIAVISIYVSLFNILPIPAVDGGKFLFLVIEKLRGKPLNQNAVSKIELFFFSLLIILMLFVTIKDIQRIF